MNSKCDHNFKLINVKYGSTNIIIKKNYKCTECGKVISQNEYIDYMEVSYHYGR